MGGSAFGRPASRLTTPQLDALLVHCQTRLSPHFSQTLPLLTFSQKNSHGDLDLLCAHVIPFSPKKVKGEDWGVLNGQGEDVGVGVWHPVQGGKRDAEEGKEGEENQRFRAWAIGVVKALGGTEWKRSGVAGAILNIGIPVSAVDDLPEGVADETVDVAEKDHEPFSQVDLQLLAPQYLLFTQFSRSYSNILLTHALALISPHLKLHGTHIGFHYSPYHGLEPIKFELTLVPSELCNWLGIDYERFQQGFKNEKELWVWVTNVRAVKNPNGEDVEMGKIKEAWEAIARPLSRRGREGAAPRKAKGDQVNVPWQAFLDWLRRDEDSPFQREFVHQPQEPHSDMDKSVITASMMTEEIIHTASLTAGKPEYSSAFKQETTPLVNSMTTPPQANQNMIDVDDPAALCPNAMNALRWWNRWEEFEQCIQTRRISAEARAASQKKNIQGAEAARGQRWLQRRRRLAVIPGTLVSAELTAETA